MKYFYNFRKYFIFNLLLYLNVYLYYYNLQGVYYYYIYYYRQQIKNSNNYKSFVQIIYYKL